MLEKKIKREYSIVENKEKKLLSEKKISTKKYTYLFSNENDVLICSIHMPSVNLNFYTTILSIIQINFLIERQISSFNLLVSKKIIKVTFNKRKKPLLANLINFILKLKEFGVEEFYENPYALWFYSNNTGSEILNPENYTASLNEFLREEFLGFDKTIKANLKRYSTVVEIGCGELENIKLAENNKLRYIGFDFCPNKIKLAQLKMINMDHDLVKVGCFNILHIDRDYIEKYLGNKKESSIFLFPFNVFGNIAPISLVIAKLSFFNLSFIISIYKNDPLTIKMREEYYHKCGFKNITIKNLKEGVLFESDEGLYTIAYEYNYLVGLINSFSVNTHLVHESKYGFIIYCDAHRFKLAPVPPLNKFYSPQKGHHIEVKLDEMKKNPHESSNGKLYIYSSSLSLPSNFSLNTNFFKPKNQKTILSWKILLGTIFSWVISEKLSKNNELDSLPLKLSLFMGVLLIFLFSTQAINSKINFYAMKRKDNDNDNDNDLELKKSL